MAVTGIICEYNPLHRGHKKQIDTIRQENPNECIVCLMSGNYVQRGHPAIADKSIRAKAAILAGADLVLELPITAALSSAEGFASEGVRILGVLCDKLSFGAETADKDALMNTAKALLSEDFSTQLRKKLELGLSFPAARSAALEEMGLTDDTISHPNNILATEYCKAILKLGLTIEPVPIQREGSYHAQSADADNPSATAVRSLMLRNGAWLDYIPEIARGCFENCSIHTLEAGERAILARLRTMTDAEFEALPYGSEGLWRKLMHNCRRFATLEEILNATKSKRYTRTRLDRMVMCAFLGISQEILLSPPPYTRVLAFNDRGRTILKQAKQICPLINAGERVDSPYWELEKRADDLYGLFSTGNPEYPGCEENRRIIYVH